VAAGCGLGGKNGSIGGSDNRSMIPDPENQ